MAIKIEFVDTTNSVPEEYWPKPAKFVIPEWYRKTPPYTAPKKDILRGEGARGTNSTIKKCMPVFDAISAGYIIPTPVDLDVKIIDGERIYTWPSMDKFIETHHPNQYTFHPKIGGERPEPTPKWGNPWAIRTPKGYSVLFTTPFHRDIPFHSLEGVVDTDTYNNPVLFPFKLADLNWEGIIPAGTPMVQVIPFKRENYSYTVSREEDLKEDFIRKSREKLLPTFFSGYKDRFWTKKEYN
jgi:hypothetical protein